jgi:hypothetical protein
MSFPERKVERIQKTRRCEPVFHVPENMRSGRIGVEVRIMIEE